VWVGPRLVRHGDPLTQARRVRRCAQDLDAPGSPSLRPDGVTVASVASKLVIVLRADLDMTAGKIAAQAAHAAVAAALATTGTAAFQEWIDEGQPKVVLRVDSLEDLQAVAHAAAGAGLHVEVVEDAGRTQVEPGTPTCCSVGPAESAEIDLITGALRLL